MPEVRSDVKEVKEEPIEEKKKGFFGRMKDAAADNESQLEAISTMVRLGILVWSGGILTLAYIKLPPALGIPEQKLDPTFIASVFTGCLATFNVTPGGKKKKDDKVEGSTASVPTQIIRIEQAPLKITTDTKKNV